MACPMLPAPMTTWTAVFVGLLIVFSFRAQCAVSAG
jgi:hypothetical protein